MAWLIARAERAEALVEFQKTGGAARPAAGERAAVIALVKEQGPWLGIIPTCAALGLARATFYRQRYRPDEEPTVPRVRRAPRQALAPTEREAVLTLLHDEQFVDLPPAQVWAQMLDAGRVPPCSIRTMYRVLAANQEVRERRNQLRHPVYQKPELLATGPKQAWSWDISVPQKAA